MKRKHKILSALLSACMIVTMLPTAAFATALAGSTLVQKVEVDSTELKFETVDSVPEGWSTVTKYLESSAIVDKALSSVQMTVTEETSTQSIKYMTAAETSESEPSGFSSGTFTSGSAASVSGLTDDANVVWLEVKDSGSTTEYFKITLKERSKAPSSAKLKDGNKTLEVTLQANPAEHDKIYVYAGGEGGEPILTYDVPSEETSDTNVSIDLSETTINGNVHVSYQAAKKAESNRTASTQYVETPAAPAFESNVLQLTKDASSSKKGSLTLTNYVSGLTYKVYDTVDGASVAADGTTATYQETNKLELTFTPNVPIAETTYYVAAVKTDSDNTVESDRTKITVKPYEASADTEITELKVDEKSVEATSSATFDADMTATPVEIPYVTDGNKTDAKVTFTKPADATVYYAIGTVKEEGDIKTTGNIENVTVEYPKTTDVWLKVVAENGTKAFYRLAVTMADPKDDAFIKNGTVAGSDIDEISNVTGSSIENPIELTVDVPKGAENTNVALKVDEDATVAYATEKPENDEGYTETTTNTKGSVSISESDASVIYIMVTAQDGETKAYYELKVTQSPIIESTVESTPTCAPGVDTSVITADVLNGIEVDNEAEFGNIAFNHVKDLYPISAAAKALEDANLDTEGMQMYVVTYLDVEAVEYNTTSSPKVYTVDIAPRYYVAAATSEVANAGELDFDEDVNAVKLTDEDAEGKDPVLPIEDSVQVTIELPTGHGFGNQPYVKHEHEGMHIYRDTDIAANTVEFDNPDGFSEFSVVDAVAAQTTDENGNPVYYDSLQEAVNNVAPGGVITVLSPLEADDMTLITPTEVKGFTIVAGADGVTAEQIGGIQFTPRTGADGKTYSAENQNGVIIISSRDPEGNIQTPSRPGNGQSTPGGNGDDNNPPAGTTNYKVNLPASVENGVVTADKAQAAKGDKVTLTVKANDGYDVDTVTVTDKDGKAVEVTKNSDGTYSFTMPESDVNVTATFKKSDAEPEDTVCKPYGDVDPDEWYHPYVHYMIENGYMTGTETGKFSPDMTLNRAMVAQILYAKAGKPTVSAITNRFSDVKSGDWYAEAVTWASENGVTAGYANGTFRPYNAVTREELAVMIYGDAGKTSVTGTLNTYPDYQSVSDWAVSGVTWAVQNKVITGVEQADDSVTLSPAKGTMRSEAAAMFMQYFTNVKK